MLHSVRCWPVWYLWGGGLKFGLSACMRQKGEPSSDKKSKVLQLGAGGGGEAPSNFYAFKFTHQ